MWWQDENKDKHWSERFVPYITSRNIRVLPIYYRMAPEYDPDRDGAEWYLAKLKELGDKRFRSQYEIDFSAAEGGLVYPEFDVRLHYLLRPIPFHRDWIYRRGIDPGVAVTACLWYAITPEYQDEEHPEIVIPSWRFLIGEYYCGDAVIGEKASSAYAHAQTIKRRTQAIADAIYGQDVRNGESIIDATIMDASAWRREGSGIDLGSVVKSYQDAGIYPVPGTKDVEGSIELVKKMEASTPGLAHPEGKVSADGRGFPVKYVYPSLRYYLNEKKYYHRRTGSDRPDKKAGYDHLMDCERMLVAHDFDTPVHLKRRKESKDFQKLQELKTPKNLKRDRLWTAFR